MIRPAAFGRLCVETRAISWRRRRQLVQPPSGGCVLKHDSRREALTRMAQPPSGGCVLKLLMMPHLAAIYAPAAFGRLFVETLHRKSRF